MTAYRVAGGALVELNTRPTRGAAACHLAVGPSGRFPVVANYSGGSVTVFPLAADGSLGEPSQTPHHHGSGVHPDRQTSPHPHLIGFDPTASLCCASTR